ncbi:hypothetical protein BURMUCF1_2849, partial [Burkholderia multivorans ATCC BAA-247]
MRNRHMSARRAHFHVSTEAAFWAAFCCPCSADRAAHGRLRTARAEGERSCASGGRAPVRVLPGG